MKLKAVVKSLDDVAEGDRQYYTQREDGAFALDLADLAEHPDARGLKKKNDEVLGTVRSLKDQLKAFEGIDPEKYAELVRAAEEKEREAVEKTGEWDQMKKRLEETHGAVLRKKDEEIAKRDQEIGRRDSFIERVLVDQQLGAATDRIEVLPEYKDAVIALLKQKKPQVAAEGDDYRAFFTTDLGDVPVVDFVQAWGKSEAAAPFLKPTEAGGSGTRSSSGRGGATGKNPWAKATWNLTEQGRITRENPTLADQLKAAARG